MPERQHRYAVTVRWTGNRGAGTRDYKAYARDYEISGDGKATILGSSDPAFRGDQTRWNPEELYLASVSACHKLWYLHLAAQAGIVVEDYLDRPEGLMVEDASGGRFTSITLRPEITVLPPVDFDKARGLHAQAHAKCYIANSIRTPVEVQPVFREAPI